MEQEMQKKKRRSLFLCLMNEQKKQVGMQRKKIWFPAFVCRHRNYLCKEQHFKVKDETKKLQIKVDTGLLGSEVTIW